MNIWIDVDTAIVVTVNKIALTDNIDFVTREIAIAFDQAGMDLVWNFTTTAGVTTQTAVTPTTSGIHDWIHLGDAIYTLEIPASGGTINNDVEGSGWFAGICDGVLSWSSPIYGFRALALNNALINGGDELDVNFTKINNATLPVGNFEKQYNTVGIIGDNFPSTQGQVGAIGTGSGGSLNFAVEGDNTGGSIKGISFVGVPTGTFGNTESEDASYHIIADIGNEIDIVYRVDVGFNRTATEVIFRGFLNSANDQLNVFAYDFIGAAWVTVGILLGQNGSVNIAQAFILLSKHTGFSGADDAKVLIRFQGTAQTAPTLNVDSLITTAVGILSQNIFNAGTAQSGGDNSIQLEAGAVLVDGLFSRTKVILTGGTGAGQEAIVTSSIAATDTLTITPQWLVNPDNTTNYEVLPAQSHSTVRNGGYDNASVYLNTVGGEEGQEKGVHGTSTNPSKNLVDAYAIMANENITRLVITPGSSLVLPADSSNKQFDGIGYVVDLNGQEVGGSTFDNAANISGIGINTANPFGPNFLICGIGTCTLPPCTGVLCGFSGVVTIGKAGSFTFGQCAEIFDNKLTIDYQVGLNASEFYLSGWLGGDVEILNTGDGSGTYKFVMHGNGKLIINANCDADTEITLRGAIALEKNASGMIIDDNSRFDNRSQMNQVFADLVTGKLEATSLPGKDSSLNDKMEYLFQVLRNKNQTTGSAQTVFLADGLTALDTRDLDDNGTTHEIDRGV